MLVGLSTGGRVIGSRTAPVEEVIHDGENGVLVDFFDVEAVAARVLEALQCDETHEAIRLQAHMSTARLDMGKVVDEYAEWLLVVGASRGRT